MSDFGLGFDILVNMSETDLQLLARYNSQRAEDAFAEIVRRHVDLVHSAALRQVRSPELAEEVSQAVFMELARQASYLPARTVLAAWLYHVTRRRAIDLVRREAGRRLREQTAQELQAMNATAEDWTHIEPLLDDAMDALEETDRLAVLLRYFQNKPLREVGQAIGVTDDAAQKRVSRAVERLREFLAKRDVNIGASGLVVLISAHAIQAAPATLALTISTAAAVAAATSATLIHATAITMSWINAKTAAAIVSAALLAGTGTFLVQQQKLTTAGSHHRALLAQQAQLTTERDEGLAKLEAARLAQESLRKGISDLPRLRNEVTQLRQELAAEKQRVVAAQPAAAAKATPPAAHPTPIAPGQYIARDQLTFAGFATPEATLQSFMWNMTINGDYEQLLSTLTPEGRAKKIADPDDREEFKDAHKSRGPQFAGMQLLARKTVSDDRVELKWKMDSQPNSGWKGGTTIQAFVKTGEEWKILDDDVNDRGWGKSGNVQKFIP